MKQSTRWKELERVAAQKLGGRRVPRWLDFGMSAPDVIVEDFGLILDCKAHRTFSFHSLMNAIRDKYCERATDVPCLITKSERQRGEFVTLPLDYFAGLLDAVREARNQPAPDSPNTGKL